MYPGSRVWRLVLPLSLSLVGCRSPVEREIDNGDEARLAQALASPEGQEKLATRGDQWLLRAVQAGQAESVEALLSAGVVRGEANLEGRALLSQAMTIEDPRAAAAVLRVLVRYGARPSSRDAQGRTALHEALELRRPRLVAELLELAPDLEDFDARPERLLVRAAQLGDAESVQVLVRAGVPLEEPSLLSSALPPEILRALRAAHLHFLLERAAEKGERAVLEELISSTAPEVWDSLRISPAHLAVLTQDRKRLAAVLKEEPGLRDAVDDRGLGLLHYAALVAEPRMATALVKAGVDLEARTPMSRTALMLAAQKGRVEMVRELISQGAEVNTEGAAGHCALSLAARGGHAATVDALVASGALLVRERFIARAASEPVKEALTRAHARFLLRWAAETGQRAEEVRLRREGVSFSQWEGAFDHTPYVRALLMEELPELEALAARNPSNFKSLLGQREARTLLHWAALGGAEKSAAWLLERGAVLEAEEPALGPSRGGTPLRMALEEGHLGVAALFIERGAVWGQGEPGGVASPEREGLIARARKNGELRAALREGRLEALPALLEAGASVDAAAELLAPTALAWRVLRGEGLEALTRRELNARPADAAGRSALHYAAAAGNVAAVEKLLTLGLAASAKDRAGITPLGYAARRGDVPTLRRLLEARASALEPARPGMSALDFVLCEPHPAAALVLLERAGASPASAACWPKALRHVLARGEEREALALLGHWKPTGEDFSSELALAAAAGGHTEVVRWLFDNLEPLAQGWRQTLLWKAAEAGARDTVALLIDRSPPGEVRALLQESARIALVAGRPAVAMLAVDRGAEPLALSAEKDSRRLVGATPEHPRAVSLAGLALALGERTFLEHLERQRPEVWKQLREELDHFPLAVRGGQLALVRRYAETGANLLGEDVTGAPLLGTAGSVEVAAWLFEHGAILEPPPPLGESAEPRVEPDPPFTVAVSRGNFDVARFFLSRGATARVAPVLAFLEGRPRAGEPLEELGAHTLHALGELLRQPAWTVAQRVEVVEQLARRFCGTPALLESALSGLSPEEVAERMGPVLVQLTRCADPRTLEVLVRRGANPHAVDGAGLDVLAHAIRAGNAPAARVLLSLGVKPLASVGEPFAPVRLAVDMKLDGLARELLEQGLRERELEGPVLDAALVLALRTHAWTLAARLLSQGASVREASGEGPTALTLALSEGGPWMVELFLAMGATDPSGEALAVLLGRGRGEEARRLLHEGRVPPDIAFERLSTALAAGTGTEAGTYGVLHDWAMRKWSTLSRENLEWLLRLAVSQDDEELATLLLERGRLDVRLADGEGRTLLHRAAAGAGARLVEYLVGHGAPLDAEARECVRPLDVARGREDREGRKVARLLEERGATPGGCRGPG
ncbi:ankyrin repeat domain-containing protein [Cystobacter fuscus]|uniref:ankyrin repeat domain-containing protein n=1 Tax=Cystobacter fuscus TaxID=43 RepID=UPI0037BFB6A9